MAHSTQESDILNTFLDITRCVSLRDNDLAARLREVVERSRHQGNIEPVISLLQRACPPPKPPPRPQPDEDRLRDFFKSYKGPKNKQLSNHEVRSLVAFAKRVPSHDKVTQTIDALQRFNENPQDFWAGISLDCSKSTAGQLYEAIQEIGSTSVISHRVLALALSEVVEQRRKVHQLTQDIEMCQNHGRKVIDELTSELFPEQPKKQASFRRHLNEGRKWRKTSIGVLLGLGDMCTKSNMQIKSWTYAMGFFNHLESLPQYKQWTGLDDLATRIKDACVGLVSDGRQSSDLSPSSHGTQQLAITETLQRCSTTADPQALNEKLAQPQIPPPILIARSPTPTQGAFISPPNPAFTIPPPTSQSMPAVQDVNMSGCNEYRPTIEGSHQQLGQEVQTHGIAPNWNSTASRMQIPNLMQEDPSAYNQPHVHHPSPDPLGSLTAFQGEEAYAARGNWLNYWV